MAGFNNSVLICFGRNTTTSDVDNPKNITFPLSYKYKPSVVSTNCHAKNTSALTNVSDITVTNFKAHNRNSTTYYAEPFTWIAAGY